MHVFHGNCDHMKIAAVAQLDLLARRTGHLTALSTLLNIALLYILQLLTMSTLVAIIRSCPIEGWPQTTLCNAYIIDMTGNSLFHSNPVPPGFVHCHYAYKATFNFPIECQLLGYTDPVTHYTHLGELYQNDDFIWLEHLLEYASYPHSAFEALHVRQPNNGLVHNGWSSRSQDS